MECVLDILILSLTDNLDVGYFILCFHITIYPRVFQILDVSKKRSYTVATVDDVFQRARRVDQYVSKKLCDSIAKCEYFSLCLDESTDQTDVSQLLIFVRTIQEDFTINEELLGLISLHGAT